jgi:Ca-activated chloride channel family protein
VISQLTELWASIHWQAPQWWWLPPLGLFALLAYECLPGSRLASLAFVPFRRREPVIRHPAIQVLAELQVGSPRRHPWRVAGRYLGYAILLLLLAAALAQPYRLGKQLPQPSPYREVMFLLDTSVSMVLRDYQVDGRRVARMDMLKGVMHHFVDELRGNRLGAIAFSESAYTLVPLTHDYHLLTTQLDRLQPASLTGRTTRLSQALIYAGTQLLAGRDRQGRLPLLVLITDVQRPFRDIDPRVVAEQLHRQGYTLHTIALGAASAAAGEHDSQGLIYQPVNFPLLQAMAERGGGRFFWARDVDSLERAITEIQQSEKRLVKAAPRYVHLWLYPWPLAAALAWLLLWQVVGLAGRR